MKEKILNIKGGEFKEWYNSLDEGGKLTYRRTRRKMEEDWKNNFQEDELKRLSEEILHLVLESEDDYEGIYAVENKLIEYLKK